MSPPPKLRDQVVEREVPQTRGEFGDEAVDVVSKRLVEAALATRKLDRDHVDPLGQVARPRAEDGRARTGVRDANDDCLGLRTRIESDRPARGGHLDGSGGLCYVPASAALIAVIRSSFVISERPSMLSSDARS